MHCLIDGFTLHGCSEMLSLYFALKFIEVFLYFYGQAVFNLTVIDLRESS